MMRCREAAPIEVRQISTPTWWKNLSSVSQGQPKRTMATTTKMLVRLVFVISRFRGAENSPWAHDEEQDDDTERQECRRRCAVECADETLCEAQNRPSQRRARDRAHAAQDHDNERHHEGALAKEG